MSDMHDAPALVVPSILAGCNVGLFKQRPEVPFKGSGSGERLGCKMERNRRGGGVGGWRHW